ncbi:DUF499 domain-containing protein [Muricoccus radiodurans]|uniref:DUF499 domain-containing protein n=1 Tax=Muricoccus radiodurans TaxID=2231721 RepID=UPI003CF79118
MLLTVRDCCVPHDHVLSPDGRADIEDIALAVRAAEADAEAFFDRNHVTAGMRQLFETGLARLDGKSQQADFLLAQAMGGGKTHLMVSFALIAKSPTVREKVLDGAGIRIRTGFGAARIVAFSGRNNPDHFFWGEIATQLGKADSDFSRHWRNGPKGPDEAAWMEMIGEEPTVILIDEMAPWFRMAQAVPIGNGTLASHGEYALANLREAARKLPRCVLVGSSLTGTYGDESRALLQTFANIEGEAKRGAKVIEPVAVNTDEIFEILKRRLFKMLATPDQVEEVAQAYASAMDEAVRSRAVARTPEQYAEDIRRCHPFQPSLREVIGLFQNNERFRKTRGLLSLMSAIVRCVWREGRPNTVHLVGVQHMDLNEPEMRTTDLPFSELLPAITEDIARGGQAVAETVDRQLGSDAGTQAANVILAASLKPDVDDKIGLPGKQVVEYLVAPGRTASEFEAAITKLEGGYHLHRDPREGRLYYSPNETIEKRLAREAENAPGNRIDDELERRLSDAFVPSRKKAYQGVMALPEVGKIAGELTRERKLIVINPDSDVPPKLAGELFMGQPNKNNFLIVNGSSTEFANIEKHVRRIYACARVLASLSEDHPNHAEVEKKRAMAEFDLTSTIEATYNQVWYPAYDATVKLVRLVPAKLSLRSAREAGKKPELHGEASVEEALVAAGKLYLEVEGDEKVLDTLLVRASDLLWGSDKRLSWSDLQARAREVGRFPFLPPGGLEAIRKHALTKDVWRERDGKILKGPFEPDRTRVSVSTESYDETTGEATISVQALDAGPSPRIHWAVGSVVSEASPELTETRFKTKELRLSFLAVDPTKTAPTGDSTTWKNRITILFDEKPSVDGREVTLVVVPSAASVRYTTDASSPKASGLEYEGPFDVAADQDVHVRVVAVDGDIEAENQHRFDRRVRGTRERGGGGGDVTGPRVPTVREHVDERRPALLTSAKLAWTATKGTYDALDAIQAASASAVGRRITVGEGDRTVIIALGSGSKVTGDHLKGLLTAARSALEVEEAPATLSLASIRFPTGKDLIGFLEAVPIDIDDPRDAIRQGDDV